MTDRKKVVVALSGGVDSTLAARLLMDAGYEVTAATMKQFDGQDVSDAEAMASCLGIPHRVFDVRDAYRDVVLRYFIDSYAAGRTPNPCMVCDFRIKFGLFYEETRAYFGADYFATGHYSRILWDEDRQKYAVHRGLDAAKDQSYMMYHLTQDQLAHILFPLGRFTKQETRRLSEEKGLPTWNKAESQDMCFLAAGDSYKDYLLRHAPEIFRPGDITDKKGHVLGRHQGLPCYTIGQRKGLGIAAKTPLYVAGLDAKRNRVIVGPNEDLFRTRLLAGELDFTDGTAPGPVFACEAKIRYGMRATAAEVTVQDDGRAAVTFREPQRAVTPGQSVVFYDGDRLIGGGTILRPL